MAFGSLISLNEATKSEDFVLENSVIKDLHLEVIFEQLLKMSPDNGSILHHLCLDAASLQGRQEMLEEFMAQPNLLSEMTTILEGFLDLQSQKGTLKPEQTHLYYLIPIIITVETSVACLEALAQLFYYYKPKAKALVALKSEIEKMTSDESFKEMKKDLKEIRHIFDQIQSVELVINLSTGLRPVEAQVLEVHDYTYKYPKAFRRVKDVLEQEMPFLGERFKVYDPLFGVQKLDWDLLDEVAYALRKYKPQLMAFTGKYEKMAIDPFVTLLREVTFYQAACELFIQLKAAGLPICKPVILPKEARKIKLEGYYNVHLATCMEEPSEMVLNDLEMDEKARMLMVTGANRGGKTTITQAVGQIQVLAQIGLFVPAISCEISLVDGLFTHFPVLEKETVDLGRFGKECQSFSKMCHRATSESLVLLNEAFGGTSHLESLKVAEEAVRALHYKRVRTIFNTHLHELPISARQIHLEQPNDCPIRSMITGEIYSEVTNPFKIYEGEPMGKSYGKEIAHKYGVTFDQLMALVERETEEPSENHSKSPIDLGVVDGQGGAL